MRLFLLPVSTRHILLYCERVASKNPADLTLLDKITNKANTKWTEWERSEPKSFLKGGWQKTLTTQGDKILRRIPYQEWGLKTVPPLNKKRQEAELEGKEKIEVLFPQIYYQLFYRRVPDR